LDNLRRDQADTPTAPGVAFLFKDFHAEFHKRAGGATVPDKLGDEPVASFRLTISMKKRS
jgi:hypothetical protein